MDDRRAALVLACLALTGAGVRYFLSPSPSSPPGDVQLQSSSSPRPNALRETARREGLITQEQLRKALLEQKNTGMRLGYTLVKLGFIEETEVSKMLARQYRMPAVDLSRFEVDPKILKLLPPDIATKHTVLPLKREGRTLTVAIADPNNVAAIEDIKFITRCDVFPVIAGEYTLRNAIDRYYQQSDAQLQTLLKSVEAAEEDLEVVEEQQDEDVKAQDLADDAPVVKLINGLLTEADLLKAILNPYGMVLVTGPTGSGKTTTLYSALSRINTIEVNILTAEDPVEYNLMGINQVLVRNEVGMTFAAALKAFLRQDPNIIMVGEIRDLETGSIAIKAALTGHLVLSTLHTNDAPSTVTRMVDMGIEPFNVASAVNLIVAQRLVRRICSNCKQEANYTDEELHAFAIKRSDGPFFKGAGCDTCNGTGYKGRQGLYEVMALSSPLRRLVLKGGSTEELREQAVKEGMLTLRMDGMVKVKKGVTSLEEVVKETAA